MAAPGSTRRERTVDGIHHGPEARVCESEDGTLALFGVGQHQ